MAAACGSCAAQANWSRALHTWLEICVCVRVYVWSCSVCVAWYAWLESCVYVWCLRGVVVYVGSGMRGWKAVCEYVCMHGALRTRMQVHHLYGGICRAAPVVRLGVHARRVDMVSLPQHN